MFERQSAQFAIKMIGSFLLLDLVLNAAALTWR